MAIYHFRNMCLQSAPNLEWRSLGRVSEVRAHYPIHEGWNMCKNKTNSRVMLLKKWMTNRKLFLTCKMPSRCNVHFLIFSNPKICDELDLKEEYFKSLSTNFVIKITFIDVILATKRSHFRKLISILEKKVNAA